MDVRGPARVHLEVAMIKLISWNLLRLTGASLDDVVRLIRREEPDLLLMQEATRAMDGLPDIVGGQFQRNLLPGRVHGLAVWSPEKLPNRPIVLSLQSGAMFDRVCQIIDLGPITIANVHLSHGQILNRRQLRRIAKVLPHRAAVVGDYNLIGRHVPAEDRSLPDPRGCLPGVACAAARSVGSSADRRTVACSRADHAVAGRGLISGGSAPAFGLSPTEA